jgi:hypothetical protein
MPPKQKSDTDVCNNLGLSDCAHAASRALLSLGLFDCRNQGVKCDTCKHPIQAKGLKKIFSSYPSVVKCNQTNSYLIYQ